MISIIIKKKLTAWHGQQVLQVNLQIPTGGITVISGPSGAGKTTFLKIIAGLIEPEEGNIRIDEAVWLDTAKGISVSAQKRKTGFVFQNYALFPNMTVQQHLEYATDDAQWIKQLLTVGKLEAFAGYKPEYLSGGQQQRLAILRAMAIKPKLLLMDEPFSALDQKMKAELIAELKVLWQQMQITTLIVSHYPQELEDLSTGHLYLGEQG